MTVPVLQTENALEMTNTTTHEESEFADALIKAIDAEGFNLELFRNVFLGYKGSVLRPDILIPAYGLVVEINGSSHNTVPGMAKDAAKREYYAKLKLFVMDIENVDAHDPVTRQRLVTGIINHLKANPLDKKKRGLIRVNICAGRKTLDEKVRSFAGTVQHAVTFTEGSLKGFKVSPAYGGSKFIFRKKRVSHG